MSTIFEPFVLKMFAKLFRDEASFLEFASKIESACKTGATPFFSRGKIIGITVSSEAGKKLLSDHIVTQWIKDPEQLRKIAESMGEQPVSMKKA